MRLAKLIMTGIIALALFTVPLFSSSVAKVDSAGSSAPVHPATYHYSYRYYRPVKNAGSTQCYWYYTNGSYVYVCR